jgi:protein-S-isoprenylcysteine O-methyltransferase Ste14
VGKESHKESPTEESPKESPTKLILLIEGLFQKW